MKRISALVLILTSLPAFVSSSGRVVRHPTAIPSAGHERGLKRSLFEVKHMSPKQDEKWNEYVAGYVDHHPAPHHYVEMDEKHEDESKMPSDDSHDDKDAWASSEDEHDYDPWHDPESSEDHDPWFPDSSDEDAWGEYVAGYPDAKEPKGEKEPKGTKAPKGGKHPPVDHDKDTKAAKGLHGYRAEAYEYIHSHPVVEPDGEDGQFHYKPVHMPPRPRPVQPTHHQGDHPLVYANEDDEKRVVVPFELQFSVDNARKPKQHELYMISVTTAVFIESYLGKVFDEYFFNVELDDFELVPIGEPTVDHGVIALKYHGVAFFDKDGDLPTVADMSDLLEDAFTEPDNAKEYLKRVNTLDNNIFSYTQHVLILTKVPEHETSKLMQGAEEAEAKSIVNSPSAGGSSTSGISLAALTSIIAAAALVAVAVAMVVYRKTGKTHDDDDLSFIEGVFIGDQGCAVENELGDDDFEVSSVSSNNATRAENFLRLVARDEDDDDDSGSSRFKIEMGGNKAFSKA